MAESEAVTRGVAVEAPVALEINGIGYAVMMATPVALDDFVAGFLIAEALVQSISDIGDIAVAELDKGWIARIAITGAGGDALLERARRRVSESSCGLCGIENLEQLARPLPKVAEHGEPDSDHVFAALEALGAHQPINRATGGMHAAAWVDDGGAIRCVREDVGRHNALDKLVGALARHDLRPDSGFILTTSRCSYEIVEKSVMAGACNLVTISVPTSLAVERAAACGLSLYALARSDSMLRFA